MDPKVVGVYDANLQLLPAQTIAAAVNGPALDLGAAFAPGAGGIPMLAIVPVTSVKLTAGTETYAVKIQDSADNATWIDRSPPALASNEGLTTDGGGGTIVVGAFLRQRYSRAVVTPGGSAPSIVIGAAYFTPLVNMA